MEVTRVYVDGFNLYHGIIAEHRLHWLDLAKFAQLLNRGLDVDRVIYCTAMVSSPTWDPSKAQRQQAYHQALRAYCPTVEIVLGNFSSHRKPATISGCPNAPACAVKVTVRSEKGSDVNLASRLLHDAHLNRFSRAIVISGDSDLVEPIRLITSELRKSVWVRNPRSVSSKELEAFATDYARIRPAVLQAAQLPNIVFAGGKQYQKPTAWTLPRRETNKQTIGSMKCPQQGCLKTIETFRHESMGGAND